MAGFGDILSAIKFGWGRQNASPEAIDTYSPWQKILEQQLFSNLYSGSSQGVPSYPGEMYVPRTGEDQAYFDWVEQSQPARQAALDQILSGKPSYEVGPEWAENYYEKGIRKPALREHEQVTLPGIKEAYAGPGYWGTARASKQVDSAENLATELSKRKSELMYGEELASRQAQESALMRQAQYGPGASMAEANIMGSAGQYAREIEQERILADLQRWFMGETVDGVTPGQYDPFTQQLFQALGLTPYAVGQSSSGYNFGWGGS